MRINVYPEELTEETELVTKTVTDNKFGTLTFYGIRFYLKSPGTDTAMSEQDSEHLTNVPSDFFDSLAGEQPVSSPSELWEQAEREFPWPQNPELRRARYWELMREHGYIIDREPDDESPLFGCGYDPRDGR